MSFAKEVYDKLSTLDVKKKIEKKNGLDYLSWANCWAFLMTVYPESSYEFKDTVFFGDGTCEVWVSVVVKEGEKSLSRTMTLAVFDYKNKAIKNPSATDVCNTRMRCLVKCVAMFGLGLSLYAGEDLPKAKPVLDRECAAWGDACAAVKSKKVTPQQAASKYDMSDDDYKYLCGLYREVEDENL